MVLYWDQQQYQRTIVLDRQGTNVPTIRSAPGFNAYSVFCDEYDQHGDKKALCYDVNMISDVESDNDVDSINDDSNETYIRTTPLTTTYSLLNTGANASAAKGSSDYDLFSFKYRRKCISCQGQ